MSETSKSFVLCPNCTSAFSITSQQLEAALGAVRCGSCKKIFNAKYNLVTTKELNAFLTSKTAATEELDILNLNQADLTPEEEAKFEEVESNLDGWLDLPAISQEIDNLEPNLNFSTKPANLAAENLLTEDLTTNLVSDEFLIQPVAEPPIKLPNTNKVKTMAKKSNSKLLPIILILILALVAGIGGTFWFVNSANQDDFKFSKVSVNPTASQLQLRVEFNITNTTKETKVLPTLEVHLLNLSGKTITQHLANAASLGAPNSSLSAGQTYSLSLTVERPYTLVKTAKVLVYQPN